MALSTLEWNTCAGYQPPAALPAINSALAMAPHHRVSVFAAPKIWAVACAPFLPSKVALQPILGLPARLACLGGKHLSAWMATLAPSALAANTPCVISACLTPTSSLPHPKD